MTQKKHRPTIPHEPPPSIEPADVPAEVEHRLAMHEPDVELLAADVVGVGGSRAVRVFIDSPGGVSHALCERVTSHLRDLLRDYALEVSSPGPKRPLTRPDHFRRYLGSRVRVRTREVIEGRKDFKGELIGADQSGVTLAAAWGTLKIPHDRIRRSNLEA